MCDTEDKRVMLQLVYDAPVDFLKSKDGHNYFLVKNIENKRLTPLGNEEQHINLVILNDDGTILSESDTVLMSHDYIVAIYSNEKRIVIYDKELNILKEYNGEKYRVGLYNDEVRCIDNSDGNKYDIIGELIENKGEQ